ncbi:hypothetical protein MED01_002324 [Micromonospora sp. MED01]|uniref:hypothetical protein n=1 Tax=Micromonospora alfalfae TaxID=2911212 RepID=UPI001EE8D77C|nr:hypothetical protein [Micromonospora alfalfae]MCG5464159.1 hypothetical protein [Micromonospora alfalfae]
MTAAVQWINPGALGFTAGGVLIVCAVGLLLCVFGGRRVRAEVHAEVGPPPGYWHPVMGPQRRANSCQNDRLTALQDAAYANDDAPTQLFALRSDEPDATMVHPRVPRPRSASR